jgi:hypothetical protein
MKVKEVDWSQWEEFPIFVHDLDSPSVVAGRVRVDAVVPNMQLAPGVVWVFQPFEKVPIPGPFPQFLEVYGEWEVERETERGYEPLSSKERIDAPE